ncbi:TRAP transporter large permease [Marivibrio halodurans]|uniref:TRAP transporter large permease protein n=1 Tax=Marivibrio halodurans TaxID=2039722 RepID=A0A8J7RYY2_9PROT|nr:TRAP transporter large permease [Marivibrio halodurans]MBP5856900.1 TRAP transporter large permease [Marivibrio halodurans]
MSDPVLGALGFAAVLMLAALRVPIAVAMGAVGAVGAVWLMGWPSASYVMASLPFEAVFPYGLSVVPLFIFMGVFAAHSGLSANLYSGVHAFLGHLRGGLAMATVGACGVFGAICGSSLATCATMGRVALPEMRARRYAPSLAGASVAAGGTLGVLIPPSILLVVFALLTEQSIGALFAAAMIPGALAMLLYIAAIAVQVRRRPEAGPAAERAGGRERWRAFKRMWDAFLLILLVIGGIYAGLFSPTEAAAIGAGGAILFTALRGRLTLAALKAGVEETAELTGMIFLILIGAALFNFFIEASGLTRSLVDAISAADLPAWAVLIAVLLFYLVLGCFMDSLSMILLTVTPAFGIATGFGFDPIWFGILVVSVAEIGLITPPIGMNLFVIQGVSRDLSLGTLARGILPFILADGMRIALLVLIPGLSLWLPRLFRLMP